MKTLEVLVQSYYFFIWEKFTIGQSFIWCSSEPQLKQWGFGLFGQKNKDFHSVNEKYKSKSIIFYMIAKYIKVTRKHADTRLLTSAIMGILLPPVLSDLNSQYF